MHALSLFLIQYSFLLNFVYSKTVSLVPTSNDKILISINNLKKPHNK